LITAGLNDLQLTTTGLYDAEL